MWIWWGLYCRKKKLCGKGPETWKRSDVGVNMGVRKRKVSLGNIAEQGPVGTQKKTSKQFLEPQSSEERITCMAAMREAMHLAGTAKGREWKYIST